MLSKVKLAILYFGFVSVVKSCLINSKVISSRWKGSSELPLVNHRNFKNELKEYVEENPKRDVLVVYGVKSVGKSRVLKSMINEWRSQKRLVVDISLKSKDNSPAKLLQLFAQEYVKGSSQINQLPNLDSVVMNKISRSDNIIKRFTSFWVKFIAALKPLPFSSQILNTDSMKKIDSTQLGASIVNAVIDSLKIEGENGIISDRFMAFLNALEKENLAGNRPILIIRDVQRLVDASAPENTKNVFNSLFSCFEEYKEGDRNLSVILESSDYNWSQLEPEVRTSQSFFAYEVEKWKKEEGLEDLVNNYKIFDAEEYEKIWSSFGGHGGQWFALHRRLRRGDSLDEAIKKSISATASSVRSTIHAPSGDDYYGLINEGLSNAEALVTATEKRLEFLKFFVEANCSLHKNFVPRSLLPACNYLCRQNILWIEETMIRPQRKDIENVFFGYKYKV